MFDTRHSCVQKITFKEDFSPYLKQLEIWIRSNNEFCPNSLNAFAPIESKATHHIIPLDTYSEYVVRDLLDGTLPAKITFFVCNWRCTTCYFKFNDHGYPYSKNLKHTDDFLEYVVETFLNLPMINIPSLASNFDTSVSAIEVAIRKYRKKVTELYRSYPQCKTMWLHEFNYRGSKHIVGFGETLPYKVNETTEISDFVLLGFCKTSIEDAEKEFSFSPYFQAPAMLIISSESLSFEAKSKGYNAQFCEFEAFPESFVRIGSIIDMFEYQEVRSDLMMFRIWFQNRYRRNEVKKQGKGKFLSDCDSNRYELSGAAGLGRGFYGAQLPKKQSVVKECTYAVASVKGILESFEIPSDRPISHSFKPVNLDFCIDRIPRSFTKDSYSEFEKLLFSSSNLEKYLDEDNSQQ